MNAVKKLRKEGSQKATALLTVDNHIMDEDGEMLESVIGSRLVNVKKQALEKVRVADERDLNIEDLIKLNPFSASMRNKINKDIRMRYKQ